MSTLFWDVDTQHDFMRADGALYVPDAEAIIPNLARLRQHATARRIPVVASADWHQPTDPELSTSPDWKTTFPPHCLAGTPGAEKLPETALVDPLVLDVERIEHTQLTKRIRLHGGDLLIRKRQFDVFTNPNTATALLAIGPEHVIVFGVALDVCCRFAIDGLLQYWSTARISVVTDATRPIDAARAPGLLEGWRRQAVELITTEQALAEA
ncbi:MAG: isochorismatase family cysteine hydrolase [Gemmatimonadales bacterium]|nr:isochorismatase family cysteine hydrolase [Gemmatimonadales bacterium]